MHLPPRQRVQAPSDIAGSPKAFGPFRVAAGPKGSGLLRRGPERGTERAVSLSVFRSCCTRYVITVQTPPASEQVVNHAGNPRVGTLVASAGRLKGSLRRCCTVVHARSGFSRSNGSKSPSLASWISWRAAPPATKNFPTPNLSLLGPEQALRSRWACSFPRSAFV